MNRSNHSLTLRAFSVLMAMILATGMSPLTVLASTPQETPTTLTAASDPAGNGTAAIDIVNGSKTIDGGLEVSDNTFALKARGEGRSASAKVGGDVANRSTIEDKSMFGVIAYAFDGGSVGMDVDGSVVAKPAADPEKPKGACGIFHKADSGSSSIKIGGNVSAAGRGDTTGIMVEGAGASTASMKVGGSVAANSSSKGDEAFDSYAIDSQTMDGASVSIEVGGDVSAEASTSSKASGCGAYVYSGTNDEGVKAGNTVTVHGSIHAEGVEMSTGAKVSAGAGGSSLLVVDGDIVGASGNEAAGAWLESNGGGIAGLVVRGTVHGATAGMIFDGQAAPTSYDIAVWKIEVDEGGALLKKGDYAQGVPDDLSSLVSYIVKVEQPKAGGTVTAVGEKKAALAQSHGFDVARAGDKVYLDVALEPGYRLAGAHNGKDDRMALSRDENGYYVTVPEGGGIYLTADIVKDGSPGGMVVEDGMAQPVFAYSDVHAKGYRNAGSELYRFIVYVETDYDTDLDGKCDLVKTYVQVPRAAVEGKYRAPVIFQADPYSAGMRANGSSFMFADEPVDDAALMGRPEHRVPRAPRCLPIARMSLSRARRATMQRSGRSPRPSSSPSPAGFPCMCARRSTT